MMTTMLKQYSALFAQVIDLYCNAKLCFVYTEFIIKMYLTAAMYWFCFNFLNYCKSSPIALNSTCLPITCLPMFMQSISDHGTV